MWDITLVNTLVEGSRGNGGIYFGQLAQVEVNYGDFYGNENANFTGTSIPPGLGTITATNFNGDSCDVFHNIFLDPLFESTTGDSAYRLTEDSPCINAGDPFGPEDPDETIGDIGAFYYDQRLYLEITLIPAHPPIVIPASGGSFDYQIIIENTGTRPHTMDFWMKISSHTGGHEHELLSLLDFTFESGFYVSRIRIQQVPADAPADDYTFMAGAGEYPNIYMENDFFYFTKTGGVDSGNRMFDNGWLNTGEALPGEIMAESHVPDETVLHPAYPNPFNCETTISFNLPSAVSVELAVFDITGREVASLVNGHLSLGYHEVVWEAEGMGSGVYFMRLETGDFTQTQKLLLIK